MSISDAKGMVNCIANALSSKGVTIGLASSL